MAKHYRLMKNIHCPLHCGDPGLLAPQPGCYGGTYICIKT